MEIITLSVTRYNNRAHSKQKRDQACCERKEFLRKFNVSLYMRSDQSALAGSYKIALVNYVGDFSVTQVLNMIKLVLNRF